MSSIYHPRVKDPRELWKETIKRMAERHRQMDLITDVCTCRRPVEGPVYFKIRRCLVCTRVVK